jgi:hypothetical protein
MENDTENRKTRERSPKFPFISLEKALERATKFYEHEKRGSAPFAAAAEHWGYSSSSSGAMQTFGALRSYGLLDGTHKNMRLSELASRILLDKRPDSTERNQAKRQAALTPPIAAQIIEKWPDNLPSDATLNHFLVLELGFNESTALRVVDIIKENERFTAFADSDILSSHDEIEKTLDMEQQQLKSTVGRPQGLPSTEKRVVKTWAERTHDPQGLDILFQFGGEPTKETYEFLQDFFKFRLEQLQKPKTPI